MFDIELHFLGLPSELEEGVKQLEQKLAFKQGRTGIPVYVRCQSGPLEVHKTATTVEICFERKIHFFRALGLFIQAMRERQEEAAFDLVEQPQFDFNGMMFDVSRNAVLTVDSIKQLLLHMAVMGLDGFMLYAEDMFVIPEQPYFGYMRGKYSLQEMKECDDYAAMFGIEIIPCIQTLAHVEHVLKWSNAEALRDTHDIFLVGSPQTYRFIEEMIRHAAAPFRSNRIHIGMDEAHSLGLGRYLQHNGFRTRFNIMNEHLREVLKIVDRLALKPMLWSDMYFRLGSKSGDYYDKQSVIPSHVIEEIPNDLDFVYWDYYHHEESDYRHFIQKHLQLGSMPIFAGGIWTWNGLAPNYRKTWITSQAGLAACKKEGVRQVFATMWGDNGAETNLFCALPGMQLYAEHGYAAVVNQEKLESRFRFCTGENFNSFMHLEKLDLVPDQDMEGQLAILYPANPSKFLLWQDLLLGLFDKHVEGRALDRHYSELEGIIRNSYEPTSALQPMFEFYSQLCAVLRLKSELGLQLKIAYDANDQAALALYAYELLPELSERVAVLRKLHRKQWMKCNKPFGWEVLDIRYGGILARIDTALDRLNGYLTGELQSIEELEEERLYFDGPREPGQQGMGSVNAYHRIATAGSFI